MSLYTSAYLKQLATNIPMNESQRLFSQTERDRTNFDIFLCHSYLDRDEVKGLSIELKRLGYSVYVDWIVDPHLNRENVTKEAASHIRKRLHSSKTLLLAISVNAPVSKWMPWELGYVDGHTSNCAIIPVSKDTVAPKSYKGVEYLSLYPFITNATDTNLVNRLWTVEEADKYTLFSDWVSGGRPTYKSSRIF